MRTGAFTPVHLTWSVEEIYQMRMRTALASIATVAGLALTTLVPSSSARADDMIITGYKTHNIVRCHKVAGDCVEQLGGEREGLRLTHCIEVGPDGNLYVCSFGTGDVMQCDERTGQVISRFVKEFSGGLDIPTACRFGPDGLLYVSSYKTHSVNRYDPETGDFVDVFIWPRNGDLNGPSFMYWRGDGFMYLMSDRNGKINKYDEVTGEFAGTYISETENGMVHPQTCLWPGDGMVYVDWYSTSDVRRYDEDTGEFIDIYIPEGLGGLAKPHTMQIGPGGLLYIVSSGSNEVLSFDALTGDFVSVVARPGNNVLREPTSLVFVPEDELIVQNPVPGLPGVTNTFDVTGATPNEEVFLGYGLSPGVTPFPDCPGLNLLIGEIIVGGSAFADEFGNATISVDIPAEYAGQSMFFQAVEHAACLRSVRKRIDL